MDGDQYNVALTIFFVSYIIFEVPANMALKYLSPRVWSGFRLRRTTWPFADMYNSSIDRCVLGSCHDPYGHCA